MFVIFIDFDNYLLLVGEVVCMFGVMCKDCSMIVVNIYLVDYKVIMII